MISAIIYTLAFLVTCAAIPLEEFIGFPFGEEYGDQIFDKTTFLPLSISVTSNPFPFFGNQYSYINVDDEGIIYFTDVPQESMLIDVHPSTYPRWRETPLLAPYWSDQLYFYERNGEVTYRILLPSDNSKLLSEISEMTGTFFNFKDFKANWGLIVTWNNISGLPYEENVGNYFQAVIATDGSISVAIYNYNITEIYVGSNETAIEFVGYSSGNGQYYSVKGSLSNDIKLIDRRHGNTWDTGQWIFRIDREEIVFASCTAYSRYYNFYYGLSLSTRYFHLLGGTAVTVTLNSFCLHKSDIITCEFAGQMTHAMYINGRTALCVSPSFNNRRRTFVWLRFRVYNSTYIQKFDRWSYGFVLSVDQTHEIDVVSNDRSLLLNTSQSIQVSDWPIDYPISTSDTSMAMYQMDLDTGEWFYFGEVEEDDTSDTFPSYRNAIIPTKEEFDEIVPVIFESSVHVHTIPGIPATETTPAIPTINVAIKRWSGVYYLRSHASLKSLSEYCESWYLDCDQNLQTGRFGSGELPPCPPTRDRCEIPNSGYRQDRRTSFLRQTQTAEGYEQMYWNYFHPGTAACYRSTRFFRNGHSQYCCYRSDGMLVTGFGGGSAHFARPSDWDASSIATHHKNDLIPFIFCCKSNFNCDWFYSKRPPDDASRYRPPRRPACFYGDPHLVTLDGYKYTFNGKGEYTLVQTENDSLTIQGRMESAPTIDNRTSFATTFTAIVAKQPDSDAVQFQLFSVLQPVVDGDTLEMENGEEAMFTNVIVRREQNNSYSATFTSGVYIKLEQEFDSNNNPYVSAMIISLPESFENVTSGLLGSFNDDQTDDLLPKNSTTPLSLNSTLETIHWNFGVTWIIGNENDSIFYYNNDSWSDYYCPDFMPLLEVNFTDPELKRRAEAMCQGDFYCLFDIAATGDVSFGMTTLIGGQVLDTIANISQPVSCDPPCENGACVANDTCSCSFGYSGDLCKEKVYSECATNPCLNGATCREHAGTYLCACSRGNTGKFCGETLPIVEEPESKELLYWRIITGVLAGLLVISWIFFIAACLVSVCKKKGKNAKVEQSMLPSETTGRRVTEKILVEENLWATSEDEKLELVEIKKVKNN